jgi:hypothetical protein
VNIYNILKKLDADKKADTHAPACIPSQYRVTVADALCSGRGLCACVFARTLAIHGQVGAMGGSKLGTSDCQHDGNRASENRRGDSIDGQHRTRRMGRWGAVATCGNMACIAVFGGQQHGMHRTMCITWQHDGSQKDEGWVGNGSSRSVVRGVGWHCDSRRQRTAIARESNDDCMRATTQHVQCDLRSLRG